MAQGNYDEKLIPNHADDDIQLNIRVSHGLWDADAGRIHHHPAHGDCVLRSSEELRGRDYGGN